MNTNSPQHSAQVHSNGITRDTLTPVCDRIWKTSMAALPVEEAGCWQVNRVVQPHGTRNTVLLWRVWDARCRAHGLDKLYFCWCLNYDPERYYNRQTHWQLQLYINKVRLYRHAETLRQRLPELLQQACPEGFAFETDDHSVQLVWHFDHPGPVEGLADRVSPMLMKALTATRPVFDQVFAVLAQPASPVEKARVRGPLKRVSNPAVPGLGGLLARDIRPAMRAQVLEDHKDACAICGVTFKPTDDIHIDHIIPVSAGGLTEPGNLQPTHARCNLSKGGRKTPWKEQQ